MRYVRMFFYGMVGACVFSYSALLAGEIRGKLIDASTKKPLNGVNIYSLPERVRKATTDAQGNYLIKGLSAGTYRLMASYIGYNIQTKEVEVGDVGTAAANFEIILSALDVETPVVAASKHEQALIEAPTAVSILFSKDIAEAEEATTLAEALKYVPSIDYAKGSEGHYNITARGFNGFLNNTMQVLIDGRIVNAAPAHFINWTSISISEPEIDRIEVIKGPGSALYGANAFSGVINIVTKSPREITGTTVRVSAGSIGTFSGSLMNAGVRGKLAYKVSGGFFENRDFTEGMPLDTLPAFRQLPDKISLVKGDARVEYNASDKTRLTFTGGSAVQQDVIVLASTARSNRKRANDFYISGKLQHKNFKIQSYYNGARTDTILVENAPRPTFSFADYDIFKIEAQQSLDWGKKNKLIFGGEYLWQLVDTKGQFIPQVETQNLFGFYGQFETRLWSNLGLIFAGRVDHHPTVKFQISPKAGLIYTVANEHAFRFTVNQAYLNPVFVELYADFPVIQTQFFALGFRGNRNLDPRKITAFEVGYQGFIRKKLRINLDLYHYNLKDFISSLRLIDFKDPSAVSFVNFGQVNSDGIDFGLLYLIGRGLRWSFNISAIRTDKNPVYSENPKEDVPALNAPKLKLGSSLLYENPHGFYGNVAIRFVDGFDWAQEVLRPPLFLPQTVLTRIESYVIPDITLGYRFPNEDIRISITASNLFDKKYIEIPRGSFIRRKIIGSFTTHF